MRLTDHRCTCRISTLIIAPAFLQAANYIILGWIAVKLGTQYLRIHPVTYSAVCVSGDLVSLVVQAIGGGMASSADTLEGANTGGEPIRTFHAIDTDALATAYVMVSGVFAQMRQSTPCVHLQANRLHADRLICITVVMLLYSAILIEFTLRYRADRPVQRME